MVDNPRLTPQSGSARFRRGSRGVPTIPRQLAANLRAIPAVQPTGLQAQARLFNVEAQALAATQEQFAASFDEIIANVQLEQRIEAERQFSEGMVTAQRALKELERTADPETSDLTKDSLDLHDSLALAIINNAKSPFQRRYLENKFAQSRERVAARAIDKQVQLEIQNIEIDYQRKLEASKELLFTDPLNLEEVLEDELSLIEDLPITGPEKKKRVIEATTQLGLAAAVGLIDQDPDQALALLESGEFDEVLNLKEKLQLLDMAEAAIASDDKKRVKVETERLEDLSRDLTDRALLNELTMKELVQADLDASETRVIANILKSNNTSKEGNLGNVRLYRDMFRKIQRSKEEGRTIPNIEMLELLDPSTTDAPINEAQYKDLRAENEAVFDSIVGRYMDIVEAEFSTPNAFGVAVRDPKAEQQMYLLEIELKNRIVEARDRGVTASQLLTPGSGQYIGNELISQFKRSPQEIMRDRANEVRRSLVPEDKRKPIKDRLREILGGRR